MGCGIDFGTSNSAVGFYLNGKPQMLALENGETTIPTALFFENDGGARFGRAAISEYIEGGEGRFMRALKSILGSSLIDERTQVGKRTMPFADIIAMFLRHLRALAGEPESVVLGRPVYFVDGDAAADARAQSQLEAAARQAGFKHIEFQFEPIAAAFDYEQRVDAEELALIADIGGGTTDFSLVRVSPARRKAASRKDDILGSGGVHVGGTDFDRVLSLAAVMPYLGHKSLTRVKGYAMPVSYFSDLATWHKIPFLYNPRALREAKEMQDEAAEPALLARYRHILEERLGHKLLFRVEDAKIELSEADEALINLDLCAAGLSVTTTRGMLDEASADLCAKIGKALGETLKKAGVKAGDVSTLAFTGGASRMPQVRRAVQAVLPGTKSFDVDALTSVGTGLAIEAARRFG